MAQTLEQLNAAFGAAAYHLEVEIVSRSTPQRSGPVQIGSTVSMCYRSPAPLSNGSPISLKLWVAVLGDPPPPGRHHVKLQALEATRYLEVLANGALPTLQVVDGGVRLLSVPDGNPALGPLAHALQAPKSAWWSAWLALRRR